MSDDRALDVSFALIGGERFRAGEAERERYLKRVGAGIAVVLVHVLILAALLSRFVDRAPGHAPPKEIIFVLPPLQTKPRPVEPALPVPVPSVRPIETTIPRTITLPPPPKAQTQEQSDVMKQIGKELACGAGSYEHLNQAEREACRRQPWRFKKNQKGVIVLDINKAPPPPDDEPVTGADQDLKIQQTADPCLAAGHTHSECIHKTIFGR